MPTMLLCGKGKAIEKVKNQWLSWTSRKGRMIRWNPKFLGQWNHSDIMMACCHLVTKSFSTLRSHGLQPTRLLCPRDFPGTNTGVGCHFLLQGIFLNQGSNPGLLHCRQILYQLSYKGCPHWACRDKHESYFCQQVLGKSQGFPGEVRPWLLSLII